MKLMKDTDEALTTLGWMLLPNVGGMAGNYIISSKCGRFERLPSRPVFPSGTLQIALWTSFNVGMGYAAFLVYRDGGGLHGAARLPMAAYAASLCFNWAWPPLFYDKLKFSVALIDITLLSGTVGLLGHMYRPINDTASKIMIPCFLWSLWVTMYNMRVWRFIAKTHRE
ncbi:translocator protein-like [Ornithodoros turicata]|uniref:translocator protein-like n=1 Tax=Ornithodoros turicata TaxID=34597 RepID=UPI0031396768